MFTPACSLHPMDVRLLKIFVSVIQGEPVPDLHEDAMRRRQRDILLNWSQRVTRAASSLAVNVAPEDWTLFTQIRPFFITRATPVEVTARLNDLFNAHSLSEIVDLFREEVALLDADQADSIIDAVRHDQTPEATTIHSADVIEENLRAYLIAERHELDALFEAIEPGALQLEKAGSWLSWRGCLFTANMHPWWVTRTTSLTGLASRKELNFLPVMADPRGMFANIVSRVPNLQNHLPYALVKVHSTGMCIPPASVATAMTVMDDWPEAQLSAFATPGEISALREALYFAQNNKYGLWEASEMTVPLDNILPIIEAHQAEVESFIPGQPVTPEVTAPPEEEEQSFEPIHYDASTTEDDDEEPVAAPAPESESKPPFWQKFLKKK
ncbi:MAG: hypothetical protein WCJ56_01005 [bacterium]